MKKLVFLFLSLLTAGSLFQACDNSKTYAEMLEDEKNAVNKFIKDNDIRVISLEEFERDTITASKEAGNGYDEYVAFSNGVYMQIVDRGGKEDKNGVEVINEVDTFANNNVICTRYVEQDMMTGDTTCFNVPLEKWKDILPVTKLRKYKDQNYSHNYRIRVARKQASVKRTSFSYDIIC